MFNEDKYLLGNDLAYRARVEYQAFAWMTEAREGYLVTEGIEYFPWDEMTNAQNITKALIRAQSRCDAVVVWFELSTLCIHTLKYVGTEAIDAWAVSCQDEKYIVYSTYEDDILEEEDISRVCS